MLRIIFVVLAPFNFSDREINDLIILVKECVTSRCSRRRIDCSYRFIDLIPCLGCLNVIYVGIQSIAFYRCPFTQKVIRSIIEILHFEFAVVFILIERTIVLNNAEFILLSLRIFDGCIHSPSGSPEKSLTIPAHLFPGDNGAWKIKGEIMAFLIHVYDRSGIAVPEKIIITNCITVNCRRIIHHEISTNVHSSVGGDMADEASFRNHDTPEHCSCGIIRLIYAQIVLAIIRPALNLKIGGFMEIPHNVRCGMGIRLGSVIIINLRTVPPETPSIMERLWRAFHIDNHRSSVCDIRERI